MKTDRLCRMSDLKTVKGNWFAIRSYIGTLLSLLYSLLSSLTPRVSLAVEAINSDSGSYKDAGMNFSVKIKE